MAIRVVFSLDLSLSENTSQAKELGQTPPWQGTNDLLDDGGTFRRRIAAGGTDVLVSLPGLTTGRMLGVKTSATVTMKKNASTGEAWTIRPLGTGALDGVFFCTTDGITSLYFSNAGSSVAEVTISVAGMI